MTSAVEVIDVSKNFGSMAAVKPLSLSIEPGEFFSLLGPSGCGKTTLLRMIAGFETPSSGSVFVSGKDMTHVPPHKRPVNMVFQSYALFPHLTIGENVAFGLKIGNQYPKAEIGKRVTEALELVRLPQYVDRLPSQLSGGQQQRVALARAIVKRPQVLLLDEPLSALDLKIRQEMQEELSRLQKQLGITFIMVTHDQGEALALSNRLAVFYQGNLEQLGTPEEIYERPRTTFVASFIGQTNLLQGKVVKCQGNNYQLQVADITVWVEDADTSFVLAPGETVSLAIRTQAPEVMAAVEMESHSGRSNWYAAVIEQKSYQGHTTDYWLRVSPQVVIRISMENYGEPIFSVGQKVAVHVPPESVYLLKSSEVAPEKHLVSA